MNVPDYPTKPLVRSDKTVDEPFQFEHLTEDQRKHWTFYFRRKGYQRWMIVLPPFVSGGPTSLRIVWAKTEEEIEDTYKPQSISVAPVAEVTQSDLVIYDRMDRPPFNYESWHDPYNDQDYLRHEQDYDDGIHP